jgi:hypothetical protein
MFSIKKYKIFHKFSKTKGIIFHLIGIVAILWFLIRVIPKPDRIRYPCQQMSITVALTYIAFWAALFTGLRIWIKHARWKTSKVIPSIVVICILFLMISGAVFAVNYYNKADPITAWDPIPKEPIGTPKGANPGRVVWVWDSDATEREHTGIWWESHNNNQDVIDQMYSDGLQNLAGEGNDADAWDSLFRYFNEDHGNGDIGYQPGEKIAIKINLVYCFVNPYNFEETRINANPYVVKSLLGQLINNAGVAQEDIILFDSSRNHFDWFYNRVFYEEYPAEPLIAEFPNISYIDAEGGAPGRIKVSPSDECVYFTDGSCEYRTLPTCIVDSEYLINMPICKRHFGGRVTLSGKNLFGSWIESVTPIHPYHTTGYSAMGNPAPQTDLFAHEQLGKKTLLYIGDGLYAVRYDNALASYFQMYPFNDDWMNSLFFSQDGVAIDSVMYDFLYTEGTGPSEGTQNYIHQAAEPPTGVYDPEGDGVYLSESLGVHEHWDETIDIFSVDRYSGPTEDGIDYIPLGVEQASPSVTITNPKEKWLYILGNDVYYMYKMPFTLILGPIDIEAIYNGNISDIQKMEFYIDDSLVFTDDESPYIWRWMFPSIKQHNIKIIGFNIYDETLEDTISVWKFI